ncbi:NAD-dependent epimerase/dehydratase family protein [Roseomonas xinghualingensis]|uniref:NAD-dependent epimerase/dehydratase family protein n=1 Tax=Roseomonas xinghualingensis TaxID=2986475 RepID=UPI0021F1FF4B|nr:NAD-dependent epimerase/dehydratase family protein [Roseomonas sp. SXEYE001]MCV4208319.1 NAD-dependent epimerase/dehydratase family protein [Roseomonas sp. SXEYE001]
MPCECFSVCGRARRNSLVRRVCLVGAGFISRTHAEALQYIPGVRISSIVDPRIEAAQRLALDWKVPQAYASVDEALDGGEIDAASILVPPAFHADAALPFLRAGKPVLIEKPMAASSSECNLLLEESCRANAFLGVNQNFLFHPAFRRMKKMIAEGRFGKPSFVDCIYNVALRQLATRQFGHWMFQDPGNILLEQAIHPLSQIASIAGAVRDLRAIASAPMEIAPSVQFYPSLTVTMSCDRIPAQLRFAVGQSFPFWQITVVCDDGVIVADILGNRLFVHARSKWLDAVNDLSSSARTAALILSEGGRNAVSFGLSSLRLKPRSDPFFQSMRDSIAEFHAAIDHKTPFEAGGAFGGMLVATCERIRDEAFGQVARPSVPVRRPPGDTFDVAVLGGTGFIGAQTVREFVQKGLRVSVMARSIENLPEVFRNDDVVLHRGDIRDEAAVARAIGGARIVINLAHGGGAGSFDQVKEAMVGGAEVIARVCLARGVRRLIHVGSIASLYLGPQPEAVTGGTPPDPQAERRSDYARAKALCDQMLLEMHAREGLPVCILRPGLVVGEGGSLFHSGLGFYNNEQHCIGWNEGKNQLPFVLVQDVAKAIVLASDADAIDGKCYNLVGDVRPTARQYVAAVARALERPLRFHPKRPAALWIEELGKWTAKRAGGRRVPLPSRRDILSRGLQANFDCSDAKRDLNWLPVDDPDIFVRHAIGIYAK